MSDELTLHYGQDRLLFDRTHRDLGICAGVGYGKSHFGGPWLEEGRLANPKSKTALIIAPTYRLLKHVSFAKYLEFLRACGYREGRGKAADYFVNKAELAVHFRSGQETICVSGTDENALVAYTAYRIWMDEAALLSREIRRRALKRLRCPKAKFRQILHTFTPEGLNWLYELFHPDQLTRSDVFSEDRTRLLLHGSSFDNPYNDEEFLQALWDEFGWDEPYYQNYVLALWVSLARNRFYFAFDETKHVGNHPLIPELREFDLTFDFNVGKMSWSVIQRIGSMYRVCACNRANGRNIDDACEQFIEAFPPAIYGGFKIAVLGDASGHDRSTQSYVTGYEIIKNRLEKHYPRLTIEAHLSNPFVEERSRVTNMLFAKSRLYIDRSCRTVIESAKTAETDIKRGIKKPKDDNVTHPMEAVDMGLIVREPPKVRRTGFGVTW